MTVGVLGLRAALAALLLVAGGAKLADLPGFATSAAMLAPRALVAAAPGLVRRLSRPVALLIALAELVLGAASLCSPAAGWPNLAVLAAGCAFVAVAAAGYAFRRGRPCRCFGALSRRGFDLLGVARAVLIAVAAGLATTRVPASGVRLGLADRGLLLASAVLLALVAAATARGLAVSRASGITQMGS